MKGELEGEVFLYHDQGNIGMHSAAFREGVMINAGLPFPCTGPSRGTAFDIAGESKANPRSFSEVMAMGSRMVSRK